MRKQSHQPKRKNAVRKKFRSLTSRETVHEYVLPLIQTQFYGQSSTELNDHSDPSTILNLGEYLCLLDKVIRKYNQVYEFTADDKEFLTILCNVAEKRKNSEETSNECFERLKKDAKTFERIYHKRGKFSQELHTGDYWGTRQQLLCGKVICDWLEPDKENDAMDPIFGALLCPCGGRAGAGDSTYFHKLVYDQDGHFAYHSAVHDAFGYLITFHGTGPGYDYLKKSKLKKGNPLSGQLDGVMFWKKVIAQTKTSEQVLTDFALALRALNIPTEPQYE